MIPFTQTFLPLRVELHRVVKRRGHVRAQHTEEVEDHGPPRPVVIALETPDEENDADDDTQQDATTVRCCVPNLLFFRISYHSERQSY